MIDEEIPKYRKKKGSLKKPFIIEWKNINPGSFSYKFHQEWETYEKYTTRERAEQALENISKKINISKWYNIHRNYSYRIIEKL